MVSKNEVKYIQSLYAKKNRQSLGMFVAEGVKTVGELLAAGLTVRKVYALQEWNVELPAMVEKIVVSEEELQRLSNHPSPQQVLGVFEIPVYNLEQVKQEGLQLALDGIQDPGNLGTIIRLADWFGIETIFASSDTVDCYNPKVVQASMGSLGRVMLFYGDLHLYLKNKKVFGAMLDGKPVHQMEAQRDGVLLIGNEGGGIRAENLGLIQHKITIPRKGKAESLNAAMAAGIILSHLTR